MRAKLFLVVMLGLSMTCFAEAGREQSKLLSTANQVENVTNENKQPVQVEAKKNNLQSIQETGSSKNKRSLMIDYCRKHTC